MSRSYKHLFGPVPSRRFGRSLGIDLTPFKTCSYDCIFCQLGHTTRHTLERKNYVDVAETLAEIEHWLENDGKADQITLAGSGEPTLHAGFGEILGFIKARTKIPVAVLTNGSRLFSKCCSGGPAPPVRFPKSSACTSTKCRNTSAC